MPPGPFDRVEFTLSREHHEIERNLEKAGELADHIAASKLITEKLEADLRNSHKEYYSAPEGHFFRLSGTSLTVENRRRYSNGYENEWGWFAMESETPQVEFFAQHIERGRDDANNTYFYATAGNYRCRIDRGTAVSVAIIDALQPALASPELG